MIWANPSAILGEVRRSRQSQFLHSSAVSIVAELIP
jgi:hypothetical protein